MTASHQDALEFLEADHEAVRRLFDEYRQLAANEAPDTRRKALAEQICMALTIHAKLEEELFYPAVRQRVGKEVMNEADEEHHVAKLLIAELDAMDGSESHFDAKFLVLAEIVRHHIKEEEGAMLPKARAAKLDFEALAEKMRRRKERLLADGVPGVGEEAMVEASRGKGDSPAQAAKRKPPRLPKRPT